VPFAGLQRIVDAVERASRNDDLRYRHDPVLRLSVRLLVPLRHARLAQAFDDTLILLVEGRIVGPVDAGPGLHGEAGIGFLQLGGGLPLLGCNRACRALGKGPESDQLGRGRPRSKTSASRVRREKAALSSGCEPHPATDPPANTTTPTANAKLSGLIYPPPR
jgi:hypothetical protein